MDQQFKMKLLNSIKTILKEETDKSIFVRRRIHYIEDYLDYTIRVANQSRNTCRFQNRDNYVDYIVEETVSRLWQGWFSQIDDMSEDHLSYMVIFESALDTPMKQKAIKARREAYILS